MAIGATTAVAVTEFDLADNVGDDYDAALGNAKFSHGIFVVGAAAVTPVPLTVKIVGFNDYHGALESPGTFGANLGVPAAKRPAVGGMSSTRAGTS